MVSHLLDVDEELVNKVAMFEVVPPTPGEPPWVGGPPQPVGHVLIADVAMVAPAGSWGFLVPSPSPSRGFP
jgi:hypothetical protein